MLDRISLVVTIVGAIIWLLVGLFQFDLVAYICGGQAAVISRVIYTIVGIAGLWCISLLFRERDRVRLQPENDTMSPIYVENPIILGRVTALIRSIS